VTYGNGTTGVSGAFSSVKSLVGTGVNDRVGSGGVIALATGNYVVSSPSFRNLSIATAGAAAKTSYNNSGVAVFVHVKGGAMVSASIGGQKFSYDPGLD